MDLLERAPPRLLLVLAIGAGLTCQLLLGTSYLAASLDPLAQEDGVPVAVVVLDDGPHGADLLDRLQARRGPVDWVEVESAAAMHEGLARKEYFGAIVVPANFSAALDSFASQAPYAALVETWTSPGASTSGSLIASRAIEIALDAVRETVRAQAISSATVGTTGLGGLTLAQARYIAEPVHARANVVNPVPANTANGLAPTYFAMAAWIGGYLGSVALERFRPKTSLGALPRAGLVAGAALLQGILLTGAAIAIGFEARDAAQLALLVALGTWMAYAIVSLLMDLLGLAGILPAFAILALGLPASGALYPEGLLPDLFRALHAIDPFTWLVEALRTSLYAPGAGDLGRYALMLALLALACTGASLAWERFASRPRAEAGPA